MTRYALLALAFVVGTATAQEPAALPATSPRLPWNHWAVLAVDRLDRLGLVTDWLPAQREAPLLAVEAALAEAERRAPWEAPPMAALAAAWHRRFLEEWRGAGAPPEGARLLGGSIFGGYAGQSRTGNVTGSGLPPWAIAEPAPSSVGQIDGLAAGTVGGHVAALASPQLSGSDLRLARGEVVVGAGPLALSAGRAPVRYGYAESAAVLFSGNAPLDRVEIYTARPLQLPWLGLFSVDAFLAWINEPRHPYHPFLAGLSLQLRPHPRLVLALQRGVMFGGSAWTGHDLGDALVTVLGVGNESENNVISGSVRWRLPTEQWLPLTLYVEWGADDNGGAYIQVPGVVAGFSVPAFPGLPEVAVGFEFSYFGRIYRRDITWYSHGVYTGGWATGETPLGHPLGGNGREYRAYGSADLLDARLRLRADGFIRDRFSGNLYAPDWAGLSHGFDADVAWRLPGLRPVELGLRGSYESGPGWSAGEVLLEAGIFF